jgi:4-amino-4-deoxy-L-arabinose transferase-like glycosyltransferase
MNALLTILLLVVCLCIALFVPVYGAPAVLICIVVAVVAGLFISRIETDRIFLLRIFVVALLARMLVATLIFTLNLQDFFGGDAMTYDQYGLQMLRSWGGDPGFRNHLQDYDDAAWGMAYLVGSIYSAVGRNLLAVQMFNAVLGAATPPIAYICAQQIFENKNVSRLSTLFIAFYPSIILWSSQGLKDGPVIFCLAITMMATMKLGERFNAKHFFMLVGALLGLLSLRFYIFYMAVAAIGGAFVIGRQQITGQSLIRQSLIILAIGLSMTYLVGLQRAGTQLEAYGNLERVQQGRAELATAQSGFAKDVDVSTTGGALAALPIGATYLLFAPFPWQLTNLRQSITLPEMLVWWASFPLLVTGMWFTLRYRLRPAMPILLFTTMLTLAYSLFQGNIGTAYRQRSQLLVFYFIFVSVGAVLMKERKEERQHLIQMKKEAMLRANHARQARRRYEQWRLERDREWEGIARSLSEKIDS